MLIPKITSYDTKLIPSMYADGWILVAIYDNKIFWHKEERKQRIKKDIDLSDFEAFYKKYPNKKSRKDAEIMWARLSLDEQNLAIIGINRYLIWWKKKGTEKEHMPHPATWLNGKRWEDDLSDQVNIVRTEGEKKSIERVKEEEAIDREKEKMNDRIYRIKQNPVEWAKLEELAKSQLTEEQRHSTAYSILLEFKIRSIVKTYNQ